MFTHFSFTHFSFTPFSFACFIFSILITKPWFKKMDVIYNWYKRWEKKQHYFDCLRSCGILWSFHIQSFVFFFLCYIFLSRIIDLIPRFLCSCVRNWRENFLYCNLRVASNTNANMKYYLKYYWINQKCIRQVVLDLRQKSSKGSKKEERKERKGGGRKKDDFYFCKPFQKKQKTNVVFFFLILRRENLSVSKWECCPAVIMMDNHWFGISSNPPPSRCIQLFKLLLKLLVVEHFGGSKKRKKERRKNRCECLAYVREYRLASFLFTQRAVNRKKKTPLYKLMIINLFWL